MRLDSFKEIAKFCVDRYKESFDPENKNDVYVDTLYVAIDEYNNVTCSTTRHILSEAEQCLLIHRRKTLAFTNYYYWYRIEYIDEEGAVTDGILKKGFSISIDAIGGYSNQVMQLHYKDKVLYSCDAPFETNLQHLWDAYRRFKKAKSDEAIDLIAELIEKDETILDLMRENEGFKFSNYILEKERNQYKRLLNEIKEIVRNK